LTKNSIEHFIISNFNEKMKAKTANLSKI